MNNQNLFPSDPSNMGGLSLLLLAGEQSSHSEISVKPMFDDKSPERVSGPEVVCPDGGKVEAIKVIAPPDVKDQVKIENSLSNLYNLKNNCAMPPKVILYLFNIFNF